MDLRKSGRGRAWPVATGRTVPGAAEAGAALGHDLVHALVDPLGELLLHLVGLLGAQPAVCYCLVDSLVRGTAKRRRDVGRIAAMSLGDLRQRLAGQLLPKLVGGDAHRLRGSAKLDPTTATTAAMIAKRPSGQADFIACFGHELLQALGGNAQLLGEGVEKGPVAGPARGRLTYCWRCGCLLGQCQPEGGPYEDECGSARNEGAFH
jgi:hypothetical protein